MLHVAPLLKQSALTGCILTQELDGVRPVQMVSRVSSTQLVLKM